MKKIHTLEMGNRKPSDLLHRVNPAEYLVSSKAIHTQDRIYTMSYAKYDDVELLHRVNPVEEEEMSGDVKVMERIDSIVKRHFG
jgi:hypothetical protein